MGRTASGQIALESPVTLYCRKAGLRVSGVERSKLLLVDGNSLANRAFYALPPLSTSQGLHTGAVFGFLTMLLRFIQEMQPTHIAVTFDHPSPTFRHKEFEDYKKTRKPSPEEFKEQMPVLKQVLDALNLGHLEIPGYEADDLIGTLSSLAENQGFQVTILSGDRDCLQLVDDNVEAVLPVRGISETRQYTPETVMSEMGLLPCQVVDYKALAGDSSDNIPGVKGIGQKTAQTLLKAFRNLDDIYENIRDVSPARVQRLLEKGRDSAFLSRSLATIKKDVPIPKKPACFEWPGPDADAAKAIFSRLEFYSLIPRLDDLRPAGKSTEIEGLPSFPPGARGPFRLVQDKEGLEKLAEQVCESGLMSIYAPGAEVTGNFQWPPLVGISAGESVGPWLIKAPDANLLAWQDMLWKQLGPLIVNPRIRMTGFDLKWLFTLCFRRGLRPAGPFFDILVAYYLIDPTRSVYRLSEIGKKYGHEVPFLLEKPPKGANPAEIQGALQEHAALGANACSAITQDLLQELSDQGLAPLAKQVELPLTEVLAAMEATGVGVDLGFARSIRQEFAGALADIETSIYKMAGLEFNLGSPKQLAHVLFDKLGLTPVKKTKTGFSTDAEVLEILSLNHELPGRVMEYRHYAKLKSTYLDVLEDVLNPTTGRIHSTFHQTVTATGRLSSSEPNLQNIPVRGELGRSLRRIFVPPEGWSLMAADYSQIELRIMAHMAGDPTMIEAFRRGEDIHTKTASEIFGVDMDEVDSDLRGKAKAVNFGVIYGISDFGLAKNTGVTREEARKFIDAYFSKYPKVKEFMDKSVRLARKKGYAETILGRRRNIPDIDARIRQKRSFAERAAINTPIQGSAADIIKLAMVRIFRRLRDEDLVSRLILQVHDELIFEVPLGEEHPMRGLVTGEMEQVMELSVPLKVELDVGKSWYDV